jgi:hypothetical protein
MQFISNYSDLSTDNGFQFEFPCSRCGTGFRTEFQETALGKVSGLIDMASSVFGGVFGTASDVTNQAKSASYQKTHDQALEKAIIEIKPSFMQCPRCNSWVCRQSCWNNKKGLCKTCAPDLGVEMAAAQASKSVEEVWAHAAMAEEDKHLDTEAWREGISATCPQCEKPLANNVKFCPSCGCDLKAKTQCKKCQAKLQPGAKFCADCGSPC